MKAVSKGCNVNRAAIEHRVPRTTLQDRISGKVQRGMEAAMNAHPISSIAAIIPGSTISDVSCSSDVTSPSTFSVPVHPISTETNTTPNSTSSHFSHSSDAISLIPVSNNSPSPLHASSSTSSVSCTVTSSVSSASVTDAISKYLVQYVSPPPAKKSTISTRVIGTRVLTSAEGLAILREKEDKKKKEIEEKERKKRERLERKKEKEELAKKRGEEKSKKHHNYRDSQNGRVKDRLLQGPLTKWKALHRY